MSGRLSKIQLDKYLNKDEYVKWQSIGLSHLFQVKSANPNSFKELNKIFKKYEGNSDDYDCFVKVNHPDLTAEINTLLEEGNKFIVNQSEIEKINELVKYIRKVDINSSQEIVSYITKRHSDRRNLTSSEMS